MRARHLGRLILLAAGLVAAAPSSSAADAILWDFSPDKPFNDYFFQYGDKFSYTFRLGFDRVLTNFSVIIDDSILRKRRVKIDRDFDPSPEDDYDYYGRRFRCVEMALGGRYTTKPRCVVFTASAPDGASLPEEGYHYEATTGAAGINIGISYDIFGFPYPHDPVDIGEVLDWSSFTVVSNGLLFRIAHAPGTSTTFGENVSIRNGHCGDTGDLDECAANLDFSFGTPVPEPGGMLLLSSGLAALALREVRRRRRN